LKEKCKNLLISPPIPTSYDESTFLDSDYTDKEYINKDEIAVLGMRKDFEEMAKSIYDEALKQKLNQILSNTKFLLKKQKLYLIMKMQD
jgi:hypothetical protein